MDAILDVSPISKAERPEDIKVMPISTNAIVRPLLHTGQPIESLVLGGSDIYVEKIPEQVGGEIAWVLPHSKRFPRFINEHFNGPQYVSNEETFKRQLAAMQDCTEDTIPPPFPYQRFIYEYMRYGTPNRGILLEHGLGSGKTRTVIMIAESFRERGLDTIILTPAFLATNFVDEIHRWVPELKRRPATLRRFYHFVSYNAGGRGDGKGSVFEQLARLGIGFADGDKDAMPYIKDNYRGLQPPKNKLIVIEEAHGLNRSFSSTGSAVRQRLYRLLMEARDCKIVMMSGTPMVSNPFELASLYNILRGPMQGRYTAFPEAEAEFIEHYLDYDNYKVRTSDGFCRRIVGLGSYFKGITDDHTGRIYPRRGFANEQDEIVLLEMSAYQSFFHDINRFYEVERDKSKRRTKLAAVYGASAGEAVDAGEAYNKINVSSSYRSASRKASNFAFPEGVTPISSGVDGGEAAEARQRYKKDYDALLEKNRKHGYFNLNDSGLKRYSIKMYTIYKSITTRTDIGAPHIVNVTPPAASTEDISACPEARQPDDSEQPLPDIPEEPDIDEPEQEGIDITAVKAVSVADPDDPLTNNSEEGAKFRDVFMSDEELNRKYGAGRWTVKGGPALVYSFYNKVEGVGLFSKVLESHGFTEYDGREADVKAIKRARRYAFIKGGMTPMAKRAIMSVFNSRENMHGQLIQVIFVTLAAAEGISLFQLRQVHIMEPFWDNVTIRQVIGRAMRLRSHFHLPEDERSVFVQRYVAVRSEADRKGRIAGTSVIPEHYVPMKPGTAAHKAQAEIIKTNIKMICEAEKDTTDEAIMEIANIKDRFQADLLLQRRSAAVDCTVNRGHRGGDALKCFSFPDEIGPAFTISARQDTEAPLTSKVVTKETTVFVVKSGGKIVGLHYNEHVTINVPIKSTTASKPKLQRFEHAIKIYEPPVDYAKDKPVDRANLLLKNYLITVNGEPRLLNIRDSKTGALVGIKEE